MRRRIDEGRIRAGAGVLGKVQNQGMCRLRIGNTLVRGFQSNQKDRGIGLTTPKPLPTQNLGDNEVK